MSKERRDLVCLTRARKALAEAKSFEEVKDIRDQGHAALKYAKSRRDIGAEARNDAAEIVIEAECRLGEMLSETMKPGRPAKCSNTEHLPDLGIGRTQSHRWQAMARTSMETRRELFDGLRRDEKEITSKAVYKLGKQQSHRRQWANERPSIEGVCSSLQELADTGKKFRCIYADPPWGYGNQQTRASTDNHYKTMSVEQIAAEPVSAIADDDAHLHLWTTNGFLREAFDIISAWGFEYRSCFVWVKSQMGIGNYWRLAHEFLLLGIRGKATNFLANDEISWIETGRTIHSRKPYDVRLKIMKVSPGPYLEMYGREAVPDWTVYGNQITEDLLT